MKFEPSSIYELDPIVDDPRFEGFAMTAAPSVLGRSSLDDDLTPGFADAESNGMWQQPSLASHWVPPKVIGRVSEFNDYPCVDCFPAFSERAVDGLLDMLEANGEILPLVSDTKTRFFIFNILTISNALDTSRSMCEFWCDPPTTATTIDHYEFHRDRLAGLSIFRLQQKPISVFVTNQFVDRVDFLGLNGFDFKNVWSLSCGSDQRREKSRSEEETRRQLKRQSLVVVIPFDGSFEQRAAISEFENAIDRRLGVADLEQRYYGSYSGHDEVDDAYRMFFTTPDAETLFAYLRKEISSLSWSNRINVFLRFGNMYDKDALEELRIIY